MLAAVSLEQNYLLPPNSNRNLVSVSNKIPGPPKGPKGAFSPSISHQINSKSRYIRRPRSSESQTELSVPKICILTHNKTVKTYKKLVGPHSRSVLLRRLPLKIALSLLLLTVGCGGLVWVHDFILNYYFSVLKTRLLPWQQQRFETRVSEPTTASKLNRYKPFSAPTLP